MGRTFLSRRFMGRTGASLGAGRFVPRGEDGGSIDASLMVVMEEDRRCS
jgi:hypothetical protein